MEKINANKTNLNKAITWSTSRYNEMKKSEAIEDILKRINKGKSGTWAYGTGSYSDIINLYEWKYFLIIRKDGRITLTCPQRKERYELIKKEKKR